MSWKFILWVENLASCFFSRYTPFFIRSDSITASRPGSEWVNTFSVILRDVKSEGGEWYLIKIADVTVKKISMKYFCIIKENIGYMEWVIQSSMFFSFYLFLSMLLRNIDSALISDLNAYIWISNCIQIFEFILKC